MGRDRKVEGERLVCRGERGRRGEERKKRREKEEGRRTGILRGTY